MKIGITGLPGSGKSTAFSAITHIREEAGENIKQHLGAVKVADTRLDELAKTFNSKKITYIEIILLDIPGFNSGALPDVDAFACVTGLFYSKDVVKDIEKIKGHFVKPVLYINNIAETDIGKDSPKELSDYVEKNSLSMIEFCGKTELDILEVPENERASFLKEMGVDVMARDKFIKAVFDLLDLITFFTVKGEEARAWAIRKGTTALEAAGKIHTDMKRGFIRAETVSYKDLMECGGKVSEARSKGLLKVEGKEYVVEDGDILDIRFNV